MNRAPKWRAVQLHSVCCETPRVHCYATLKICAKTRRAPGTSRVQHAARKSHYAQSAVLSSHFKFLSFILATFSFSDSFKFVSWLKPPDTQTDREHAVEFFHQDAKKRLNALAYYLRLHYSRAVVCVNMRLGNDNNDRQTKGIQDGQQVGRKLAPCCIGIE